MRKEEARIIEGLGSALGLDNASGFEILKTAAEALGCIVDKDGTTSVPVRHSH